MALLADRKLDHRDHPPVEYGYSVQSGAQVWRGSIVAICSDFTLIPAGTTGSPAAVAIVGIAEHQQSNPVSPGIAFASLQGPQRIRCRRGSFKLPFDTAPPASAINTPVYAVDDQTVSLSSSSGARLQVGVLEGFDETGNPWVKI
jgi:hypothetical protein